MSLSRPGEMVRIAELAGNDPYRTEVLMTLAILRERSETQSDKIDRAEIWMTKHDKEDEIRFAKSDDRMARIEANAGANTSGVNDYKESKQQLIGMRRLVIGAIFVVGAVYGAFKGLGEIIEWLAHKL